MQTKLTRNCSAELNSLNYQTHQYFASRLSMYATRPSCAIVSPHLTVCSSAGGGGLMFLARVATCNGTGRTNDAGNFTRE
jgi:hypothetical protein